MFVLERILRGLSEESTKPAFSINSTYSELLLAVDGLRSKKSAKYDQKYYQSVRFRDGMNFPTNF